MRISWRIGANIVAWCRPRVVQLMLCCFGAEPVPARARCSQLAPFARGVRGLAVHASARARAHGHMRVRMCVAQHTAHAVDRTSCARRSVSRHGGRQGARAHTRVCGRMRVSCHSSEVRRRATMSSRGTLCVCAVVLRGARGLCASSRRAQPSSPSTHPPLAAGVSADTRVIAHQRLYIDAYIFR